jgi:hypothetical protein
MRASVSFHDCAPRLEDNRAVLALTAPLGHHEVLGSGNDVSDQRDGVPGARLETQGGRTVTQTNAPSSARTTALTLMQTEMSGLPRQPDLLGTDCLFRVGPEPVSHTAANQAENE